VLTTIGSRGETADADTSSGAAHGRSTLEPVPRPASAKASERDGPAEVAQGASQAGSRASQSLATTSETAQGRWAARRGRSPNS
jgi:hypothetical protein